MAETELAGTRIPRWTVAGAPPEPGLAELAVALPPELVAALHQLAPLPPHGMVATPLLAAHLKVLAELSAERTVLTGYRPPEGGPARQCAATVADGSWRQLLDVAERATEGGGPFCATVETMLDLSGADDSPGTDDRLALRIRYTAGTLRLRYRRDVATAEFAERLAGYYRTALALLAADPDAAHHLQSLVSGAELHTHLHELSGRRVPAPDRLFVALFEDQVLARPEATAAVHNGRRWSYRELNERANRLAHLLLRNGLAAEDVVAVCLERNLDWLAAMLGVFKAGGVYLPVRPDFPPERVATQLDRSGCRFGLTQPGSAGTLLAAAARAGGGCTVLDVEDGYRQPDGGGDPAVRLAPGQLAYIYFTSGSTGTPKGAMCEHGGLLNHLYAKADDLDLGPGDVVTQTASQCFDISLWQLAAPLLVGACTEIIDTELQLDVGRFIGRLAAGGIQVIQIVPAYLDVLLCELERHRVPLGDLRSVSVTGEALRASLVHRWFALYPEISLVNAYGATELSDDTMHAVLRGRPEREFPIVVVGRSLRNINTYVLNDRLRVAPLGAPGEIAFSGICVGRGYINDPERTAQAFTDDPYRAGTRLYRTGDFGRWLPEGTIEFLGRRDEQVKIRGFRIEIGEIEHRLLQAPGVREAAVVIDGRSDQTRNLVAFVTGPDQPPSSGLRAFLAGALPDYMVPAHFHRIDALPLNENGKVNKRSLVELAGTLAGELGPELAGEPGRRVAPHEPPATPTERRLVGAWAEILAVPPGRIGRADDFFRLGGTSLAAVRLLVKLDRPVSLRQLVAHPVLNDLAALIDGAAAARPAARPPRQDAGDGTTSHHGPFSAQLSRTYLII